MARKPADLVAASVRPQGRQVIWQAIRRLRSFTLLQLERETGIRYATLMSYLIGLHKAGIIEEARQPKTPSGDYVQSIWTLVRDTGVDAPRVRRDGTTVTQGRVRENLWRTLRILGQFNARELAVQASTADLTISAATALDYVGHLYGAGYLVLVEPVRRGKGVVTQARYRLLKSRNTGPLPPMVQRTKCVFDPNLGKVMSRQGESS